MSLHQEPWERALRGLHTVVLGLPLTEAPQDLRVVRVSCDVPPSTLGPLLEARSRIERVLGTGAPLVEVARARVLTGLRRHLLGDLPSVASEGTLVDVWNRFASLGPSVLVLDAADAADAASLDMLRHILGRPGWMRLPLVLVMRGEALPLAAAQLVDAVRAASGEEAILRASIGEAMTEHPKSGALESQRAVPFSPSRGPVAFRELPPDVLRVLRVLAIAGSGCETSVLAAVLEASELSVLDAAQRAADAGVPLEDRGEGRFYLPPAMIADLRSGLLPSLAAALHRRVAMIVGRDVQFSASPSANPSMRPPHVPALTVPPSSADEGPRPGNAWDVMLASPPSIQLQSSFQRSAHEAPAARDSDTERPASSEAESTERSAARSTDPLAARAADEAAMRLPGERRRVVNEALETRRMTESESRAAGEAESRAIADEAEIRADYEAALLATGDAEPPADADGVPAALRESEPLPIGEPESDGAGESESRAVLDSRSRGAGEPESRAEHAPDERGATAEVRSVQDAAARAAEEAARAVQRALDDVAERAAEEAEIRAAQRAAQRAAEESAERVAEEVAAHVAAELRHTADTAAASASAGRRAAEEAAEQAVERAQRELAEEQRTPVYYKPFTGAVPPPPIVARPPGKWLSPLAAEPSFSGGSPSSPEEERQSLMREARHVRPHGDREPTAVDEAHDTARTPVRSTSARDADTLREGRSPRARRVAHIEDEARAARHLAAAGDAEAAIERYFEAMQKAAAAAVYPNAVAHAQAALQLLDRLPPSETRRLQRVQFQLEAGRVLWHGAGPDDSFTLQGSLRVLESARTSLHAGDPAELVADVAVTIAGILYEIGDIQSLTRALDELSFASRALSEGGQPRAAARLFNDQASVYIRLGDPVRAAHLLTESRAVFEEASKTDAIAMVEMAETDHLFARILLHVPARPGREDDALSLGLDHALASERAFHRLGSPREAGRVLETMGRIELRKGRLGRAADRITAAVKIQESIGDVVGLARSTAALSEVMAAGGQPREACNLLADSIVLNYEKGSPLGLAFNRQALGALAKSESANPEVALLLDEIEKRLHGMEEKLGRIPIPGTPETPPA